MTPENIKTIKEAIELFKVLTFTYYIENQPDMLVTNQQVKQEILDLLRSLLPQEPKCKTCGDKERGIPAKDGGWITCPDCHGGVSPVTGPCKTCNGTGVVVRTFTGSIGLESSWRAKDSSGAREDEKKPCPDCGGKEETIHNPELPSFEQMEDKIKELQAENARLRAEIKKDKKEIEYWKNREWH